MNRPTRLVADIGGTRARFALLDEANTPQHVRVLAVTDFPGPVEAIQAYLEESASATPSAAAIAIAAPVHEGLITLTNASWTFSRESMRTRLGLRHLLLLNDFSALALSLPHLAATDLRQVGGGNTIAGAAKAVLGPGTGLGVSGLLHHAGHWLPLSGEGGHCSLAPADEREAAILALAWREFRHVSGERILSGSGLPLLHRLVATVDGRTHQRLTTPEIVARAVAGEDRQCAAVVDTFCALLGSLAGNLALTLGAQGGVYVGGGIIPRLGEIFDRSPFRARFEAKGRFASYLAAIPTYVILSPAPALLGAAHALAECEACL
ncbi:MAG TPA: glucokinase [Candidatus Accumulibacter phosphatis]|nr:MAG: Glucokinase [Candidatus Accumulibacter sp. SK-11]HAY28194.1 glucokinase [Accumulibacter sp.]HRL77026.1 glucokinase [Candidatus Accumulibacter phosphatis]HCN69651.1 glucokinase [Accumulibacter sp.]HCV12535.1 glucokinase [Accumulibacter sp.]